MDNKKLEEILERELTKAARDLAKIVKEGTRIGKIVLEEFLDEFTKELTKKEEKNNNKENK